MLVDWLSTGQAQSNLVKPKIMLFIKYPISLPAHSSPTLNAAPAKPNQTQSNSKKQISSPINSSNR